MNIYLEILMYITVIVVGGIVLVGLAHLTLKYGVVEFNGYIDSLTNRRLK